MMENLVSFSATIIWVYNANVNFEFEAHVVS